jgi:hypothetical protein
VNVLVVTSALPPDVVKNLTILLAVFTIVFFAGMFGWAIVKTWQSKTKPDFGDAFLYVASAIAALVGGIVAVAFGQASPKNHDATFD